MLTFFNVSIPTSTAVTVEHPLFLHDEKWLAQRTNWLLGKRFCDASYRLLFGPFSTAKEVLLLKSK
jgi:hypothetical protein